MQQYFNNMPIKKRSCRKKNSFTQSKAFEKAKKKKN